MLSCEGSTRKWFVLNPLMKFTCSGSCEKWEKIDLLNFKVLWLLYKWILRSILDQVDLNFKGVKQQKTK